MVADCGDYSCNFIKIIWCPMKRLFLVLFSSITGLIIIIGLFFPWSFFNTIRMYFLEWAVIVGSVALAIAVINLFVVHWKKVFTDEKKDFGSPFFIVGFIIVLLVGILLGPNNVFFIKFTSTTIITIESSLLAVLALSLGLASFRFLSKKQNLLAIIFGISTILFLLLFSGILSLGERISFIKNINTAISNLPIAGSTGILIGISLGAIITSLRVLFGFDRPFDRN